MKMRNATSEKVLMEKMIVLGSMYDIGSSNQEEAVNFQEILDYYDASKVDGYYDLRAVMDRLAPKCEDFLLQCLWLGEEKICKNFFTLEATSDGYCCTFNYDRFKYKYTQADNLKMNLTGSNRGLMVLLNGTTLDYFYNSRNTIGFILQLFTPGNFPDGTTGNMREYIINPSREVYIKLQVTTLNSKDSIKPYGINQRKCLFKDERSEEYDDHYSYPECLTKCKLRSILALCNCIPFYAPSDFKEESATSIYCTLAHITCLERYKVTWITYRPQGAGIEGFEREQEDSLSCPDCLPLCSNTVYNFEATSAAIQEVGSTRTSWGLLKGITNLTDVCLLRIYFASTATVLYKTDVLYTWYEILGNFGGLLGLCLGFSIISSMEFIYFITIKLYENKSTIPNQLRYGHKKKRGFRSNILRNFNRKSKNKPPQIVYVN